MSALGAVLCLLSLLLPAYRASRLEVVADRRHRGRPGRLAFVQRYYLDLGFLGLVMFLFWQLTKQGSFVAVSLFANIPELLVAHPSVPFDTMDGFLKHAKANPGKLSYSSAGIGTLPHITMELLLRSAGAQVTHVPYKGAAPAFTDLIAGVVQLKYDTYATSAPMLPAGKVKVLATAGRQRLPQLPNVPTVAESGFPGYEGYLWIGAVAPRGTPPEAIRALAQALAKGARSPKVAARFQADGVETPPAGPEEFSRIIGQELKLWARVVREADIKLSD